MEKQKFGRNQSYARAVNNELVIEKLRKQDYSATDLAKHLGLSNATLSSILKGLLNKGIIKVSYTISKAGKGRNQIYYTLDEGYGIIIVVSLSDNRYNITLSNIKEEVLYHEVKEIDRYDVAVIYELVLRLKDILAMDELKNIPIRYITIAVPGRVNSLTNELQLSKQFDHDLFYGQKSIINIFENHFSCPIMMENDINLSIIGEMKSGCLTNVENAMLVYIDNGMGGAFVFNNHFYGGSFGYAGEIGLMKSYFKGQSSYLDEFASLRSIKEYAYKTNHKKYHVQDLVDEYQQKGDLYNYINETARLVGSKLRDLIEVLNVSKIVISGRVTSFGEDYLNNVKEETNLSQNECEIEFSSLGNNSILIGAMSKAVDNSIPQMEQKVAKA